MTIHVGTRTESLYEVLFPIGFWPCALLAACFALVVILTYVLLELGRRP